MATNYEPQQFLPKNRNYRAQMQADVEKYAKKSTEAPKKKPQDFSKESWIEVQRRLAIAEGRVGGLTNRWPHFYETYWNRAGDRIETELGKHVDSDPLTNWIINSGFRLWNAALTAPTGWTTAGAGATFSRQTSRTGAMVGNYSARAAAGAGAAASYSRTIKLKTSGVHTLAGWVYLSASATATITLTDNGTGAVAKPLVIAASAVGVALTITSGVDVGLDNMASAVGVGFAIDASGVDVAFCIAASGGVVEGAHAVRKTIARKIK